MQLKNYLLVVSDIEKSKAFYSELFGLKVLRDFGENVILTGGLVLQERKCWEEYTGLTVAFGGNATELYFVEEDWDDFLKKLETSSFEIEYINREEDVVCIYDPDRHVIEIADPTR